MRAISMKCTQEQFESIKPKLEGLRDHSDGNFKEYPYLTSPKDENHGVSNHKKSTMDKTREVFETWNEKVFLEACGIETKPTLEEVKEYFKNAKEVESIHTSWIGDIMIETIRYDFKDSNFIVCDSSHICGITTLWSLKKGYAKIISYKDPKFEITKETVLKYQMKDEFPECFEVKLKAGKWYEYNDCLLCYQGIKDGLIRAYGFLQNMNWIETDNMGNEPKRWVIATPEEVQQALEKEAVNRGFEAGVWIKFKETKEVVQLKSNECNYYEKDNSLCIGGYEVFLNGIWHDILPQYTQQEAEEKFNCKIVMG